MVLGDAAVLDLEAEALREPGEPASVQCLEGDPPLLGVKGVSWEGMARILPHAPPPLTPYPAEFGPSSSDSSTLAARENGYIERWLMLG